jgi:hypothetical protein
MPGLSAEARPEVALGVLGCRRGPHERLGLGLLAHDGVAVLRHVLCATRVPPDETRFGAPTFLSL